MTYKILIVDDEIDIRAMIADVLECQQGYQCFHAGTLKEAIEMLLQEEFHGLVVDVWLGYGVQDGLLVMQKAKDMDIPVLMMSGHSTLDMAVHAVKQGAFDFLEKPFDMKRLLSSMQHMLDETLDSKKSKNCHYVVGSSPCTQLMHQKYQQKNPKYVWISGPVGSGKKALGRFFIHQRTGLNPVMLSHHQDMPSHNQMILITDMMEWSIQAQKHLIQHLKKHPEVMCVVTCQVSLKYMLMQNKLYADFDHMFYSINTIALYKRPEDQQDLWRVYGQNWTLSDKAKEIFFNYDWPGNEAEFIACIQSFYWHNCQGCIKPQDLPLSLTCGWLQEHGHAFMDSSLKHAKDLFEWSYLRHRKKCIKNAKDLADITGMERSALYRKMKYLDKKLYQK